MAQTKILSHSEPSALNSTTIMDSYDEQKLALKNLEDKQTEYNKFMTDVINKNSEKIAAIENRIEGTIDYFHDENEAILSLIQDNRSMINSANRKLSDLDAKYKKQCKYLYAAGIVIASLILALFLLYFR